MTTQFYKKKMVNSYLEQYIILSVSISQMLQAVRNSNWKLDCSSVLKIKFTIINVNLLYTVYLKMI